MEYTSIQKLTHDLWDSGSLIEAKFLPSLYAKVTIPVLRGLSYSMSNTANTNGEWSFQVKKMPGGAASEILFSQENPNLSVTIDAPYSIAHLQTDSERPVKVVGVVRALVPMVSILHGLGQWTTRNCTVLYYGAPVVSMSWIRNFLRRSFFVQMISTYPSCPTESRLQLVWWYWADA